MADQPSIAVGPSSVWVSYTSIKSGEVQAFGAPVTGLGSFGPFSGLQRVPTSNGQGDTTAIPLSARTASSS